jgi:hypothetical protein
MDRADISFWLSIAGFAMSTALAIVKGYEFYSARRVVFTADPRLTSSEDIGNEIVLLNKSSIPVTISYFELVWIDYWRLLGRRIPFTSRVVRDETPLDPPYGYDESVPPHATHSLSFRDEYHFDWGKDLKQDIYLKLWLVGRNSPIWLWITGPGKYG